MEQPAETPQAEETPTSTLSQGATLLIWSIRQWLVAVRERQCIKQALLIPHHRLHCVGAIYHLDLLMRQLANGAKQSIQIRCPHQAHLSNDELRLLLLIRAAQQENRGEALSRARDLVTPEHSVDLRQAACAYAGKLRQAGLSLASSPRLSLVAGGAS